MVVRIRLNMLETHCNPDTTTMQNVFDSQSFTAQVLIVAIGRSTCWESLVGNHYMLQSCVGMYISIQCRICGDIRLFVVVVDRGCCDGCWFVAVGILGGVFL